MGFMHATPGDMKSFKSSAERMALMVRRGLAGEGWQACNCEATRKGTRMRYLQNETQYYASESGL